MPIPSPGAVAALSCSVTWAVASSRFARTARDHGALEVGIARALAVTPAFVALALLVRADPAAVDGRHLGWLALSTLCSFALADTLFLQAARRLGTSRALALASIYPLWTALIGALRFGERPGGARAAGIALCVAGAAGLILLRGGERDRVAGRGGRALGVAMALCASGLWAGNGVAVRLGTEGLPLPLANALRNAMALLALSAALLVRRGLTSAGPRRYPGLWPLPAGAWRALLPALLLDGLIGSSLFVYAFGHAELAVAAPLSSLAPLFSLPVALWAGEERFCLRRTAAVAATVAGVALIVAPG